MLSTKYFPTVLQDHWQDLVASDLGAVVHSALGWVDCQPGVSHQPQSTEDVAEVVSHIYEELSSGSSTRQFLVGAALGLCRPVHS